MLKEGVGLKYFIISDIHSFYSLTIKALKDKGYDEDNPNHMLIICGDIFDRGDESYEMFMWLKKLKMKNKVILIKGNHEDLLIDLYNRKNIQSNDIHNKTVKTMVDIYNKIKKTNYGIYDLIFNYNILYEVLKLLEDIGLIDFIKDFINFYVINSYIFVHGFLPTYVEMNPDVNNPFIESIKKNWRQASEKEWEEARWTNGQEKVLYDGLKLNDKTIVCGHWHTSYGHLRQQDTKKYTRYYNDDEFSENALFDIFETEGLIAIDACTAYSKKVNVLVIEI